VTKKNAPKRRAMALGETAMTVLPANVGSVPLARGFAATVNGLDITGNPSLAQCERVGVTLRVVERGGQFALGDFANYIEERFGEEASQIIDAESGWSLKTINVYRWLSTRIAKERRRMDRLGIRHHMLVAALTPTQQTKWLTQAAADDDERPWTVKRLADALTNDEDLPPSALWVLVAASSEADQASLMAALEAQGRTVKALQRRGSKK